MARHAREVRRDAYCIACFRGPFQLTWRMAFLERRQFCALAEMLFVGWVYTLIHRVRITDTRQDIWLTILDDFTTQIGLSGFTAALLTALPLFATVLGASDC